MNAIEIRGLKKSFRGLYALDGLDMTVPVGAIYGFIGENGSGKSTTEKLICGHLVRSGYAKNLFTVRARKTDYVASKTIIGFIAGALFLISFFIGGVVGGSVAGLPFELGAAGVSGLVMCMLAKIFLTAVFVAIFLLMSVIARSRSWMSICLSLFGGMLLFMMVPMMTPLDSGFMNVGLCLAGGAIFAAGIGTVSNTVLEKISLVG